MTTGLRYHHGRYTNLPHYMDPRVGTNGLQIWPQPKTGGLDEFNAWLDKPSFVSDKVLNKHLVIGAGVATVLGLAWYGSKHRWF